MSAPSGGELEAVFRFQDLNMYLGFANQASLEWMEDALMKFERYRGTLSEADAKRPLSNESFHAFANEMPAVLRLLQMQELQVHECFHALQVLSLSSSIDLIRAFQRMNQERFFLATLGFALGKRFRWGRPILDIVSQVDRNFQRSLSSTLFKFDEAIDAANRAIEPGKSGLSAIHLMEGAAYAAQKIALGSFNAPTFDVSDKPIYSLAWKLWQDCGGKNLLAFLLAVDVSLRFGNLSRASADEIRPDKLFDVLLGCVEEIERYFPDVLRRSSFGVGPSLRGVLIDATQNSGYLNPDGIKKIAVNALSAEDDLSISLDAFEDLLEFSRKLLYVFPKNLQDLMQAPVEGLFERSYLEDYFRIVGKRMLKHCPALGTQHFFLYWMYSADTRSKFQKALETSIIESDDSNIEVGPATLALPEFRILSGLIGDFEAILLSSKAPMMPLPRCCARHKSPGDVNQFFDCNEPDSINTILNRTFGRSMRELIDFSST